MKLFVSALIALGLAVDSVSSTYLRTTQSDAGLATKKLDVEEGEVNIEMDNVDGDISVMCRIVFMDAFNDSYDQVYGVDGMTVVIEAEEPIPADTENHLTRMSTIMWYTYYVSIESRVESRESCVMPSVRVRQYTPLLTTVVLILFQP